MPPAHLAIDGHERCLEEFSEGGVFFSCLPDNRPSNCPRRIWRKVNRVYDGEYCPNNSFPPTPPGPKPGSNCKSLPPAYLEVNGYDGCFENGQMGQTGQIYCLPLSAPGTCFQSSWNRLFELYILGQRVDCHDELSWIKCRKIIWNQINALCNEANDLYFCLIFQSFILYQIVNSVNASLWVYFCTNKTESKLRLDREPKNYSLSSFPSISNFAEIV